jgi:hypothetical protein
VALHFSYSRTQEDDRRWCIAGQCGRTGLVAVTLLNKGGRRGVGPVMGPKVEAAGSSVGKEKKRKTCQSWSFGLIHLGPLRKIIIVFESLIQGNRIQIKDLNIYKQNLN